MPDKTKRDWQPWLAGLVGTFLALALVGTTLYFIGRSVTVTQAERANCEQIEIVKSSIRRSIATSDAKLGLPGTPGYAYYRVHQGELAQAHQLAQQELLQFAPRLCG